MVITCVATVRQLGSFTNPHLFATMHLVQHDVDFDGQIFEAPVALVYFSAAWCGPCAKLTPQLADVEKSYPNVLFLQVDFDKQPEIAARYKIEAIPIVVLIKDGVEVERAAGHPTAVIGMIHRA